MMIKKQNASYQTSLSDTEDALRNMAFAIRANAYAPYSNYAVGAAVQTADGRLFGGCNVENASYGLTCCAERNAVFAAIAAGAREIDAVAVVTKDGGSPCGACRQVLAEFAPKNGDPLRVSLLNESGEIVTETTIRELLPLAFTLP